MFAHPLWIKGIRASHWQEFLSRNKLWFSIVELDDSLLHCLLPGCAHGVIQNFRINERHLWRSVSHPLLDQDQTHSVVDEFNCLGVAKRMEAKMKEIALLITNSIGDCQVIETISNTASSKGIAM